MNKRRNKILTETELQEMPHTMITVRRVQAYFIASLKPTKCLTVKSLNN